MDTKRFLSITEVQYIFSQVLHDFISHFTPFSAGMEMLTSLQDPVWDLIQDAKNQMYAQINLIRFLFGQGAGTNKESQGVLKKYMEHENISITGSINCCPKLVCGLALWLSKQVYGHGPSFLFIGEKSASIQADHVRQDAQDEDNVLTSGTSIDSPKEGYALYLFHLAYLERLDLHVHRTATRLSVQWEQAENNKHCIHPSK